MLARETRAQQTAGERKVRLRVPPGIRRINLIHINWLQGP
jgi:hypothetical protein